MTRHVIGTRSSRLERGQKSMLSYHAGAFARNRVARSSEHVRNGYAPSGKGFPSRTRKKECPPAQEPQPEYTYPYTDAFRDAYRLL